MKGALTSCLGGLLGGLLIITAIFGIENFFMNNKETLGSNYYEISRIDSPFSYTRYTIYYDGSMAGAQWVWKSNIPLCAQESYRDEDGDGKVDSIRIYHFFGSGLDLERNKHGKLFAEEFQKADQILLETKARFADEVKEKIKFLQGE
jgi:hypothetical protein